MSKNWPNWKKMIHYNVLKMKNKFFLYKVTTSLIHANDIIVGGAQIHHKTHTLVWVDSWKLTYCETELNINTEIIQEVSNRQIEWLFSMQCRRKGSHKKGSNTTENELQDPKFCPYVRMRVLISTQRKQWFQIIQHNNYTKTKMKNQWITKVV